MHMHIDQFRSIKNEIKIIENKIAKRQIVINNFEQKYENKEIPPDQMLQIYNIKENLNSLYSIRYSLIDKLNNN